MRAKEIYDGLIDKWGKICEDKAWLNSIKREYGLKEDEWTSDYFFLITMSWGPWMETRRMNVWARIKKAYPEVIKDLRNANNNFNGFPLSWQNNRVKTISKYLNQKSTSFDDIISNLKPLNAIASRDHLAKLSGAKMRKKTISCFVRDYLLKDTFPIDRRVEDMLCILGLPNDEDMMVKLCEIDGVSSRVLERMLYSQWDKCPNKSPGKNNECHKCGINSYCWVYILRDN